MAAVLRVSRLAKRYGDWQAIRDVSFEVSGGEIFGLLGPNGARKTTTVESVQGLRTHDSGDVSVLGFDLKTDAGELRRLIGAQLQETALPARIRVAEALDLFLRPAARRTFLAQRDDRLGAVQKGPRVVRVALRW